MAWDEDRARMPAAMPSEYLGNGLAQSRNPVAGRAVSLADISLPLWLVDTEKTVLALEVGLQAARPVRRARRQ